VVAFGGCKHQEVGVPSDVTTVGSFAFPCVTFLENPSHYNLVSLTGRYGLPKEVAGLVKFLALDPAAAYITGQVCVSALLKTFISITLNMWQCKGGKH